MQRGCGQKVTANMKHSDSIASALGRGWGGREARKEARKGFQSEEYVQR